MRASGNGAGSMKRLAAIVAVLALVAIACDPGRVTPIAGTGTAGNTGDGGPATFATFETPGGIAAIPGGGYYVVDDTACVIARSTHPDPSPPWRQRHLRVLRRRRTRHRRRDQPDEHDPGRPGGLDARAPLLRRPRQQWPSRARPRQTPSVMRRIDTSGTISTYFDSRRAAGSTGSSPARPTTRPKISPSPLTGRSTSPATTRCCASPLMDRPGLQTVDGETVVHTVASDCSAPST